MSRRPRVANQAPAAAARPVAQFAHCRATFNATPQPLYIHFLPAIAIVVITLATYLPILDCNFIWDDDTFLTNNALIKAPDGLRRFWFTTEPPDYFPLVSSMLWVEWRLWGMDATGYHVVNVLLHVISSLLLWRVLKKLMIPAAWLAALIFAVHPVNVETVAWITERKNTLPIVFYLCSILLYLRFEDENRRNWYILALASFVLALLSKTSVVLLPVVLLGCAWWRRGHVRLRDLLRTTPFFILAIFFGLVTVWFQYNRAIKMDPVRTDDFLSRLTIAAWAVWFYLYKAIFPYQLSFIYPRWQADLSSILSYLPGIALVVCFVVFWRYRKSWGRPFLAGLGYYVVTLLPVLGFLNIYFMRYSLVADHWQYVSIPGAIALLTALAATLVQRRKQTLRVPAIISAVLVVGLFAATSWRLVHDYKDEDTLWVATLAKNPAAWLAHYNYGNSLAKQNRMDDAIAHYRQAIVHNPMYVDAYVNLGNALGMRGQFDEAMSNWRTALKCDPNLDTTHFNMAVTLLSQQKLDEALPHLSAAVRLNPQNADAQLKLATVLSRQGKDQEAIKHYKAVLDVVPNHIEAHKNLGALLAKSGRQTEALPHQQAAAQPTTTKPSK